jgi:hypothetical protein
MVTYHLAAGLGGPVFGGSSSLTSEALCHRCFRFLARFRLALAPFTFQGSCR